MTKILLLESLLDLFSRRANGTLTDDDFTEEYDDQKDVDLNTIKHFIKSNAVVEMDVLPFGKISEAEDLVLDVGAHYGYTAVTFRNLPMSNYIHSLEPMSIYNPALQKIVDSDNKYSFSNIACSNETGTAIAYNLVVNGVLIGGTTSIDGSNFQRQIAEYLTTRLGETWLPERDTYDVKFARFRFEAAPLDQIIKRHDWPHKNRKISGLKIDVEGHEFKVIEGAANTLARHKPLTMIEISSDELKMNSIMQGMGYLPFEPDGNRLKPFKEGYYNTYYCHKDRLSEYKKNGLIKRNRLGKLRSLVGGR